MSAATGDSAAERQRALLRATQLVSRQIELPVLLQGIVDAAVELVDARYGAIGVIAPHGGLERFIAVGLTPEERAAIGPLPEGHGLLGALIEDPRPIRLDRLSDDPRSSGFPAGHPAMDGFLGVPVRVGDQVFGNLYLTEKRQGPFTEEDTELVGALAATAGAAIENARLLADARMREAWMTASAEIAEAILSHARGDALRLLAERVAQVAEAERVEVVAVADEVGPVEAAREPGARGGAVLAVPLTASGTGRDELVITRAPGSPAFTAEEEAIARDLAARAGVALELARAREVQQRALLIEDRGRISRDLHDHVVQQLFGTGMQLQSLVRRLGTGDTEDAADTVSNAVGRIDESIAQIRTVIFALESSGATETASVRRRILDLVEEASAGLVRRPGVSFAGPVDLVVTGPLADDVAAVVREGITNVVKHASASRVSVVLSAAEGRVTVVVRDDGIGIPEEGRRSGLRNLERRALDNGGGFRIVSAPGETTVTWTAPYPEGPVL
ncbi:GAF domain-containing sensor histidine kinase [Herbiconiux solani]|uniref:GAF domain-containing sensor histidine kinase n=1 Tax=Herbiconiux solani TaxID=661329 RepID=UPI000825A196|nr:GAF domain-containing protein [Herbiconiux solani]